LAVLRAVAVFPGRPQAEPGTHDWVSLGDHAVESAHPVVGSGFFADAKPRNDKGCGAKP